jgi:hypothetical protein
MQTLNPAGDNVRVRLECDADTAVALAEEYGAPPRSFKLAALVHVGQKADGARENPELGGWYGRLKSATLDEREVEIPQDVLVEVGPFDTGMYAALRAASNLLDHLTQS